MDLLYVIEKPNWKVPFAVKQWQSVIITLALQRISITFSMQKETTSPIYPLFKVSVFFPFVVAF